MAFQISGTGSPTRKEPEQQKEAGHTQPNQDGAVSLGKTNSRSGSLNKIKQLLSPANSESGAFKSDILGAISRLSREANMRQKRWQFGSTTSKKTSDDHGERTPAGQGEVGPTIYITGSPPQMVRGIAAELQKLFDTGFCVDGATLRPPITYHGNWKDISDDDEVNVLSKTTKRDQTSTKVSLQADSHASTPLSWLFSSDLLVTRLMNLATKDCCAIIYDTNSLNKRSTIETMLFHRAVARYRGSPFYSVSIQTDTSELIIRNMVKAGFPPRGGLGKLVTRRAGVRRHSIEGDGEFFSMQAAEYILDTTRLTAKGAAEDIVKHFDLQQNCKCPEEGKKSFKHEEEAHNVD